MQSIKDKKYLKSTTVKIFKAIYEKKPGVDAESGWQTKYKYIFAVDNNKKPQQKKIVASVSNGIGTGLIESVDVPLEFTP